MNPMQNTAGIDLSNYRELRDKGLMAIGKIGGAYVVSALRFDPQTGDQVKPAATAITRDEIQEQDDVLQNSKDELAAIVSDMDALDVTP